MSLLPPASTESFIDVDGGYVRVLRSTGTTDPQRAPLLLIHGGGSDNSAISWYEVFDPPLGTDREVVAFDLPGFGKTDGIAPVGGAPEMADFSARVVGCLGLPQSVVIGVSMGGDVALNLALRHPKVVKALVLIAPGGLTPVFHNRVLQFVAWLGTQLPDWILVPLTRRANRHAAAAIRAVVKDPSALPQEVFAEFAEEAGRPGAGMAYVRYNQASAGPFAMRNNLLPVVSRIAVPTMFFHGADDPIVDPAGSRRASELMPDAQLVLVPNCGHWAQLEAPDRFRTEVRHFLARHG